MGNKHQHTLINQSIWAINQEVNKAKETKKLNENIATFYFINLSCENGINYMNEKRVRELPSQ